MALQLGALRDALIEAGTSQATANKAADALAGHEGQFAAIRTDMTAMRGEMIMHRWMLGMKIAKSVSIAIAFKLFIH